MKRPLLPILLLMLLVLLFQTPAGAAISVPQLPLSTNPKDVSSALQLVGLLTVLSLAPAILVMMTSFTRIVIVLSFLRQAMGTMSMPPNQVVIGLALFLTFFVMAPPLTKINNEALQPYLAGKIPQQEAIDKGVEPLRTFMFKQTRKKDLALFVQLSKLPRPRVAADIPTYVLVPSFVISELKTAFQIGFMIYLPFLVIDMVVSSILMAMGMMMLPPVMISLPFKIILFVLVDGWHLLSQALVASFR